jgi:GAF domain-containing protein
MSTVASTFLRVLQRRTEDRIDLDAAEAAPVAHEEFPPFDIAPGDPLLTYFATSAGEVLIDQIDLDSAALEAMREAGVTLVVPLVSQGELIGLLNLGPRLSERDYSSDDRKLLEELATHAAPAIRVAQLVREQEGAFDQRIAGHPADHVVQIARRDGLDVVAGCHPGRGEVVAGQLLELGNVLRQHQDLDPVARREVQRHRDPAAQER